MNAPNGPGLDLENLWSYLCKRFTNQHIRKKGGELKRDRKKAVNYFYRPSRKYCFIILVGSPTLKKIVFKMIRTQACLESF